MTLTFDQTTFLLILVLVTGLIHSLAQAPLGFLLQMTGNSLGKSKPYRALRLSFLMTVGVFIVTALLFMIAYGVLIIISTDSEIQRYTAGILAMISGLFITFKYFRKGPSTELWLGRHFVRGLQKSVDETRRPGAAFGVGMLSVLIELPLTFPLFMIAAIFMQNMYVHESYTALLLYAAALSLPLLVAGFFVSHGKRIVAIQKQRVHGKTFVQILFGLTTFGLGLYVISGAYQATGHIL